jgi:hypothetical protein
MVRKDTERVAETGGDVGRYTIDVIVIVCAPPDPVVSATVPAHGEGQSANLFTGVQEPTTTVLSSVTSVSAVLYLHQSSPIHHRKR